MINIKAFIKTKANLDVTRAFFAARSITESQLIKGTIADAASALQTETSPEFLLVELSSKDPKASFAEIDQLANSVDPKTKVIICGSIDELSFYKELIGMGVHEYLLTPVQAEQLEKTTQASALNISSTSATHNATVIAVIGSRGGVGASTIGLNLAAIFAERNYPTAVLDLDPEFGTIPLYADVEASRGFVDALEKPERVDSLFMDRAMTKVNDFLFVIGAEKNLLEPAKIAPDAAEKILAQLKNKFAYIVVDVANVMPHTHALLQNAEVLIVTEQSISGLRDSMRIADLIKIQLKNENIKIAINNAGLNPKLETPLKDFEGGLGNSADITLPFEIESYGYGDIGKILVLQEDAKKSKFVAALQKLAASYMPEAVGVQKQEKKAGFLSKIISK